MIREEQLALEEAKLLIKTYSQKKHLIRHLENIEKILTQIDTVAILESIWEHTCQQKMDASKAS